MDGVRADPPSLAPDPAPNPPVAQGTAPARSEEVRDIVRDAARRGVPLRVAGAGTWLDAGAPVHGAQPLSLAALTGIVDYVPGDLTLTARAGTPLDEIARATSAERQWLALDPFGTARGTIGATVATGSSGPLAAGFGPVRDAVLGMEVVTGKGELVRAGGRVVKNVAGYDLVRLFTGAWGTLGAVTEVTVRLRALPGHERTVRISLGDDAALADAVHALRHWSVAPLAAQLLSPGLANRLGLGARTQLLLRLAGNADALDALVGMAAALAPGAGLVEEVDPACWGALAGAEPAGAPVVRVSAAPASVAAVWRELSALPALHEAGALLHGCAVRGVVRCILPEPAADAADPALEALAGCGRTVIAERLPERWWGAFRPPAMHDALARRVRDAFDPRRVLNRGILGAES